MKKTLWNSDWSFFSDIDPARRTIQLPHDAMQTEKRIPGLMDGNQSGFYPGGVYTYEKTLTISAEDLNRTTVVEFEGVYMKSSVYLNGEKLGGRIYGYSDFFIDLTGKLREGKNVLRVVADNSQCANSRWYSGSGIYRDVWLHTAGPEYIRPDGIRVDTLSVSPARVRIRVDAKAESDTKLSVSVGRNGDTVAQGRGSDLTLDIPDAGLWTAETPELYTVSVRLLRGEEVLDEACDVFGIRALAWDAEKGFQVNGETVNLRGGCVHHDHGFLGATEFDDACLRRIRIMKEAGFNAVRISHNPASHAMLRACDQLGMYVMNETFDTWYSLKSPYDYAMYFEDEWERDVTDMIRVSYNHPSVVMYSIGNEVSFSDVKQGSVTTQKMVRLCHRLDGSRPVTNALNPMMAISGGGSREDPKLHRNDVVDPRQEGKGSALTGSKLVNTLVTYMDTIMKVLANEKKIKKYNEVFRPLDITGFNYGNYLYREHHTDFPLRVLVGSETFPAAIYDNWRAVEKMPWVVGDFLWTAWDYLGECGAGMVHYGKQGAFTQPFPAIAAGCANIDLTGEMTPQGYYTAVVYGQYTKPYLAVHPVTHSGEKAFCGKWRFTDAVHSWSWPGCERKMATVDVYSNAGCVELFRDGFTMGKKRPEKCVATWTLPYLPGKLEAVSYDAAGREIARDTLVSAGKKTLLSAEPESRVCRANRSGLIYIPIELTDENGIRKVLSETEVTVKVEGAAELAGLGNANLQQESLAPYTGDSVKTFEGKALAILRSNGEEGEIRVTVSAENMTPVLLQLRADEASTTTEQRVRGRRADLAPV